MSLEHVGGPILDFHVHLPVAEGYNEDHGTDGYEKFIPENEEVMHNNWEFVTGPKGPILLMGGYKFVKNQSRPNGPQHFRCAEYYHTKCKAKASLLEDGVMQVNNEVVHNHGPNLRKRKATEALCNMRKRAREEPSVKLDVIYDDEMFAMEDREEEHAMADLPMLEGILSIMKRSRRKVLPPVPNALETITLPDGPLKQSVLIDDCIGQRIMVFGTEENFRTMCGSERLHMDGTFKCAPTLFVQLFTIFAVVNDVAWPLLFCLLPAKSGTVYTRLLKAIKQKCTSMGMMFMPRVVFCDFESSLTRSLRYVFRHLTIKGCLFHYSQAISKRANSIGLKMSYSKRGIVRDTVRRLFYLPMLPVEDVPAAYDKIMDDDLWEDVPLRKSTMLSKLARYFTRTWMTMFKLEQWNMWSSDVRTNNVAEGFHSKLNSNLPQHPSVYKLVEHIARESRRSALYIRTGSLGMNDDRNRHKRAPKKAYKDREITIMTLKTLYSAGQLTDMAFLDGISDVYERTRVKRKTRKRPAPNVGN